MLSVSHMPASGPRITSASVSRFAELVKKIVTSPSLSARKRKNTARKKLSRVIKEQRRHAKTAKLRAVAVTLTYRDSALFSSKHISAFLDRLRRVLKRMAHILSYAWALEVAGQLHYHLLVWLPRGYTLNPAKLAKWWPWGSTWLEGCRCVKAWGRYIVKFDSVAKLPKGARTYGYGGLDDAGKIAVSRAALPRWLLTLLPAGHRARRCRGGGWVDTVLGVIYRSPYIWTPRGAVLAAGASCSAYVRAMTTDSVQPWTSPSHARPHTTGPGRARCL